MRLRISWGILCSDRVRAGCCRPEDDTLSVYRLDSEITSIMNVVEDSEIFVLEVSYSY